MNRLRNYVLMAAGLAVLVMVVGVFSAGLAIAQAVRAALVSNVDDPGRIPYQVNKVCIPSGVDSICIADLPQVLPGKRLVITHVSGELVENLPGGTLIEVTVVSRRGSVYLPVTFMGSSYHNVFVFDQPELIFCDGGDNLNLRLEMGANPDRFSSITFTLSGYMLDCSTGPCAAIQP
jgi:hypothetical protein